MTALGLDPVVTSGGAPVPLADVEVRIGPAAPGLEVALERSTLDPTGKSWVVQLRSSLELHRATLGFILPAGIGANQAFFAGWKTSAGPDNLRTCAGTATDPLISPNVDLQQSFTIGPSTVLGRADTLYVTLRGKLPSGALSPALNVPVQTLPTQLGTFVYTLAGGTPPPPAVLTLQGVESVPGVPAPYETTTGAAVLLGQVQTVAGFDQGVDFDFDGRGDDTDNCRFVANTTQLDRGGFLTLLPDGIGDLCQCGESTDDGAVLLEDAQGVRSVIAGMTGDVQKQKRCSISGSASCDMSDFVILRRAVGQVPGPPLQLNCPASAPASP